MKSVALVPRQGVERPSTPVKSFMADDPSVLPPSPHQKKTPAAKTPAAKTPTTKPSAKTSTFKMPAAPTVIRTPSTKVAVKTPAKPVKQVTREPTLIATQGPATPRRTTITQVKEFKFASESRTRRETVSPEKVRKEVSPLKKRVIEPNATSQPKQGTVEVEEDD